MILRDLKLTNFKNHTSISFRPDDKWNCITGLNGTGKTNLLEAIYYLCLLKGFTSGLERNKVKNGQSFFRIQGLFALNNEDHQLIIKYKEGGTKQVSRNRTVVRKLSEHVGRFPILLVQPIDDYKIMEGSHARRKLMDHSLAQSFKPYLEALSKYHKLLKQRNTLLKNIRSGERPDIDLLDSISKFMLQPAEIIRSYRYMLIEKIGDDMKRLYTSISSGREIPQFQFRSNLGKKDLQEAFDANRELDMITGRTNAGPHKDDLDLILDGKRLKDGSSQGQRKSFLLSFKMAVYLFIADHAGQKPILLLDDLFDKLDNQRVSNLLKVLNEDAFGQVFISDKDDKHLLGIMSDFNYKFEHLYLE